MFTILPSELNEKILMIYKENENPIKFYRLSYINRSNNHIINNYEHLYNDYDEKSYKKIDDMINYLCCKKTSIKLFRWLMNNDIFFTLNHINNLIINNRKDIIEFGIQYKKFYDILFNRFYLYPTNDNNNNNNTIFDLSENNNPIITSSKNNNIIILDLLLKYIDKKQINNIILTVFDICMKYYYKNLLIYLIHKYDYIIDKKLDLKINIIINRFHNIEDVLFHLLLNKKIKITNRFVMNMIKKKYDKIFYYLYSQDLLDYRDNHQYLITSIEGCNIDIFNYILNDIEYNLNDINLTKLILLNLNENDLTSKFIYNLLNNHKHKIDKESNLIEKCILYNIDNNTIYRLIMDGFYYSYYEIKLALNNKNISLVTDLSRNFKE